VGSPQFRNETVPYPKRTLGLGEAKRNVSVSECEATHALPSGTSSLPPICRSRHVTTGRPGDDDWGRRHRLLTMLLAATVIGPTIFGALSGTD